MKNKRIWTIFALVLVIGAIIWYLNSQRHLFIALRNISLSAIISLIGIRSMFLSVNGLFLHEFVSKFNIKLSPKEWFGLSVVTTMGNYITPFSGGMIARATYLKQRHNLPYAQFITLLASNYLINFSVIGIVGALTLLTIREQFYWQIFIFFILVAGSILVLMIFPTKGLPWKNRIARAVNTSLEGWSLIKSDKLLLVKLLGYSLANIILTTISFWIAYYAVDSRISFKSALLIGLLTSFSLLIRITPGNLGIQEAVVSLSSGLLGVGTGEGLLAALLIRAATIVPTFTFGPIFSYLLTREITTCQEAKPGDIQED